VRRFSELDFVIMSAEIEHAAAKQLMRDSPTRALCDTIDRPIARWFKDDLFVCFSLRLLLGQSGENRTGRACRCSIHLRWIVRCVDASNFDRKWPDFIFGIDRSWKRVLSIILRIRRCYSFADSKGMLWHVHRNGSSWIITSRSDTTARSINVVK